MTDQAMRLVADSEVRVIATNAAGGAAETWSIWESSKLGTDYIVLEASLGSDVDGGDQIVVVGTAPDTVVRIRSVGSSPNPPVDVRITLGAGQTYQYANASSWNVNGWSVMGDKPIALFAGNSNTADVGVMGDAVNEQIPPVQYWGREYIVAPTFGGSQTKAIHYVVASQDNTTVVITRPRGGSRRTFTESRGRSSRLGWPGVHGGHVRWSRELPAPGNRRSLRDRKSVLGGGNAGRGRSLYGLRPGKGPDAVGRSESEECRRARAEENDCEAG